MTDDATYRAMKQRALLAEAKSALLESSLAFSDRKCDLALAECEKLRADAERYRWLRDTSCSEIYLHEVAGIDSCKQIGGEGLDAAIDAARVKP